MLRAPVKGDGGTWGSGEKFTWSKPAHIADFYKFMTEGNGVVYIRLDDDIVYIDPNCLPRLVKYRVENPDPFLVYPTIINNVRTSFHMQEQGIVSKDWGIRNEMCNEVAWKHPDYVFHLHMKALAAIEKGALDQEFTLKSEQYIDPEYEAGHISINCFAILGNDMLQCKVDSDEEGYLSWWRPQALKRQNARCGDAFVIYFAYHTQTQFMDATGILNDYVKLAPPLGFRTVRLQPPPQERGVQAAQDNRQSLLGSRSRQAQRMRERARPQPRSYPGANPLQRAQVNRGPGVKA